MSAVRQKTQTPESVFDLAIAGGGIIGLSIALFARRRGLDVALIDEPRPREAATQASAGVIWPIEPLPNDSPFWPWVHEGVAAYPAFIASLGEHVASQVEYAIPGILRLGCDASSLLPGEAFAPVGSMDACPGLSGGLVADAACVTPGRLRDVLWKACQDAGVDLRQGSVRSLGDRAGWETTSGFLRSRKRIVATGAWGLEGVVPYEPLHPIRGQMLALALENEWQGPMLQGRSGYLIARDPTRIVLGATVEDVGFDARTTDAGRTELLASNRDILDPLGPFRVTDQWAGLRPCLGAGNRPLIGAADETVAVALGLFRLGVTTAPAIAQRLSAWAADEDALAEVALDLS